jgi:hypothetical protein
MNIKQSELLCARKLLIEYIRTRKRLVKDLKRRQSPEDVKSLIQESISLLNDRLFHILAFYIAKAFTQGTQDAEKEFKGLIAAAAPSPSIAFELSSIKDPNLSRITRSNIGSIGRYNVGLNKGLAAQYDALLSDNKLASSLKKHGWTPWLGETLKKRGIDPKVISLVKDQKTTAKMLTVLRDHGIKGGLHPDQVGKRLERYVNRYFGPGGVTIDNVGKTVKKLRVDADGNYKWVKHKVTRKYRATPRTYSRLVARNSMKQAHREAYYQSLQKTKLVDHYISVSVLGARTCGDCAMMHGRTVSRTEGPQYHGNCHCDLKPIWKSDSLLGDKNRPDRFYENQRDRHFLAVSDLKRFNDSMPIGSKLKQYTLLPDGNRTHIMPGPIKMRAIRDRLLGMPPKIGPKPTPPAIQEGWGMSDDAWRSEADKLFAKTTKDGKEHLKLFNGTTKEYLGAKGSVSYTIPADDFYSLHTHPNWDSPLSPGDFVSFLRTKNERYSGACTRNAIYIIRKTPEYQRMTIQGAPNAFRKEFAFEQSRIMKEALRKCKPGRYPDMTDVVLDTGKLMAKRYGLEYKVIIRKP